MWAMVREWEKTLVKVTALAQPSDLAKESRSATALVRVLEGCSDSEDHLVSPG